jgi:hypothetical protein
MDCCPNYSTVCGAVPDPNMCEPNECGGSGGNCFCDVDCVLFMDCCPNGPC